MRPVLPEFLLKRAVMAQSLSSEWLNRWDTRRTITLFAIRDPRFVDSWIRGFKD